jgi:hypothetical protein
MVLADKLTRYVNAYFEPKNLPDPEFKIWMDNILGAKKILH